MRVTIVIVFLWIAVDAYQVPAKLRRSEVPSSHAWKHALLDNEAAPHADTHFYDDVAIVAPLLVGTPRKLIERTLKFL